MENPQQIEEMPVSRGSLPVTPTTARQTTYRLTSRHSVLTP